jgi:hypothetical protein
MTRLINLCIRAIVWPLAAVAVWVDKIKGRHRP